MYATCAVSRCERPTQDRICNLHVRELTLTLQRLAGDPDESGLMEELEVTAMRQAKIGGRPIGVINTSTDNPIPYNDDASELRIEVERELRTFGKLAAASFTHLQAKARTPREYAAWMATIPGLMSGLDGVERLLATAVQAVGAITRMIDRPADKVYLGSCSIPTETGECETYLFAALDIEGRFPAFVRCPSCDYLHDAAMRQQALVEAAGDVVGTAQDLSTVMARFGYTVAASTIRGYAQRRISRGSIIEPRIHRVPMADEKPGDPAYYRFHDVLNVYMTRNQQAA